MLGKQTGIIRLEIPGINTLYLVPLSLRQQPGDSLQTLHYSHTCSLAHSHDFQVPEKLEYQEKCLSVGPQFLSAPSDSLPLFDSIRHVVAGLQSTGCSRYPTQHNITQSAVCVIQCKMWPVLADARQNWRQWHYNFFFLGGGGGRAWKLSITQFLLFKNHYILESYSLSFFRWTGSK